MSVKFLRDGEYYKERYDAMAIMLVTADGAAKLLFKDDKVGGTVKDLIYKGNGREYENIPSEKTLSRLFR